MCEHHWLITQCQFDDAKIKHSECKDMGMLLQNMKFHIPRNGHKNISHNIMRDYLFLTMHAMKKVYSHRIQRLATNAVQHPKD
jgi:hypothetical protein